MNANAVTSIKDRLIRAGIIRKSSEICFGIVWWAAVCLAVWLVLCLLDNLFRLPPGLRLPLALGGLALLVATFVRRIGLPAFRRRVSERTARDLEDEYSVAGNLFINAYQLEGAPLSSRERVFVRKTVESSASSMEEISPRTLWHVDALRKWGVGALAVIVAWLLYGALLPNQAGNALARYAVPLSDIPPVGSVDLSVTPNADLTVYEGDDVLVSARVSERGDADAKDTASPLIVWMEGAERVPPVETSGESDVMLADKATPGQYTYGFSKVSRSFCFRVFADDTYARSIAVTVKPLPKLKTAVFRVSPPEYTGLAAEELPGPPAPLVGLPGSRAEMEIATDVPVQGIRWTGQGDPVELSRDGDMWTCALSIESAGDYGLEASLPGRDAAIVIAEGDVALKSDRAPTIDFVTDNRNRFVNPGESLPFELEASDDYGIGQIRVTVRAADSVGGADETGEGQDHARLLKDWTYIGPPGNAGPLRERLTVQADPRMLIPGSTYLLEATATDFHPKPQTGRSRPIVLRIKSVEDLALGEKDVLNAAFDLLKQTIEEQRKALSATENLAVHLDEVLAGNSFNKHRKAMNEYQAGAQGKGRQAVAEFEKHEEGKSYVSKLSNLVEDEMGWVLSDIAGLDPRSADSLPSALETTARRQEYILMQLIAMLGGVSGDSSQKDKLATKLVDDSGPPALTADDAGRELKEDLEDFVRAQKRVVKQSMTLMDKGPEDLTDEEEDILGELAREEAQWANFFEEKLTDFAKLPLQDFADGSLADEFNEVIQEIKLAAKELYEKNIEMAVPQEQAGLESAEELVQNLERWLPDTPDNIKWSMEEPPEPADVPLAELPSELEDIVGELLDREEAMTEDVEDITSSWMDSIDKGAGWDAMDGPISSMSAKGVTGNRLPNQMEIGGRAGEGRTGRSHGQMVESAAEGKKGRDTPTRLTPSPFEQGSVEDSSKEPTGGATGGGKLSGHTGEGLRGPTPMPRLEDMARLAGQQAMIRQEAEALALKLRGYRLPTGDLEESVDAMRGFEESASAGDGIGVRRAFSRALDALSDARRTIRTEAGLHRERSTLPEWSREEIMTGLRDGTPRGYEEMAAQYFRVLAEGPKSDRE